MNSSKTNCQGKEDCPVRKQIEAVYLVILLFQAQSLAQHGLEGIGLA